MTRFRHWLGSPQGELVYFGVTWGLVLFWFALSLGGCVAPRAVEYYTKPEVDAIAARAQCRALARNLVQMARCNDL